MNDSNEVITQTACDKAEADRIAAMTQTPALTDQLTVADENDDCDSPGAGHLCPVHRTVDILGKRWTALIVRDLISGPRRFSELMRSLEGVTPRMLSQRLDELEGHQIVTREVFSQVPPRVEYSLTAKGQALRQLIDGMADFGEHWL